ncbi:MAG: TIGR02757 family protein [Bacteroidales bacterium]|nr:TIGR02757 family protein [Bacteroidales bacterium]
MQFQDYKEVKDFLDEYVLKINTPDFIQNDPVQFPRRYSDLRDIEIVGMLIATISWGKRNMILRDAERMLSEMGASPFDYVMSADLDEDETYTIHRTFNKSDFQFIVKGLREVYKRYDSMESLFIGKDNFEGIKSLRDIILCANNMPGHRGEKHVSNPDKNSACKRLHMFLRWMSRKDGIVDIGCWKNVYPSSLYIPLDVHVGNISRRLGLLNRAQNDKKSVFELTNILREFDKEDPIKYDFALFGIGEGGFMD